MTTEQKISELQRRYDDLIDPSNHRAQFISSEDRHDILKLISELQHAV